MSIESLGNGGFVATGEASVRLVQMLALRSMASLELKGLKHSSGSIIARIKRQWGLKGSKQAVFDAYSAICEEAKTKHMADNGVPKTYDCGRPMGA